MTTRTAALFLTATLLLVSSATAQTSMSLGESITSALAHSPDLQRARADRSVKEHQADAASASRLPTLGMNGTGSWVSETMELSLPIMPQPISFGDNVSYDMVLAVRAPLFTGGALRSGAKALSAAADASNLEVAADSVTILFKVRAAYFVALMSDANLDALQASLDRLQRHRHDLEGMLEAGMASEESLLRVDASIAQARQRVAAAGATASSARLELGRLVGRPGEEVVPVDALDSSLLGDQLPAQDQMSNRPDLQALSLLERSLEERVRAERGALLPTVAAEAGYHYGKPGVDMIANEVMGYATAGVSLSWTLWDFGSRSSQIQAAKAERRSLRQRRETVKQMWVTKLASALKKLDASRLETKEAITRVALEQRRYELVQGKRKQGHTTESDLLDAQDDLTIAELDLARARAGERLTEAEVLHALGR
jgi:outer membrane protein TolC